MQQSVFIDRKIPEGPRSFLSRLSAALLLSACVSGGVTGAETAGVDLFDGRTLDGWRTVGEADWRVENAVIEAAGIGDGFLVTENRFGEFRLTVEFWVDATTNSGVFIGCNDQSDINPEQCYEINIWDDHPRPPARTGAIVLKVMPPLAQVNTVGKWNTYDIVSVDSRVTVTLNGIQTAVLDDARTTKGFIALQHAEKGTVRFRNIRIYPVASET